MKPLNIGIIGLGTVGIGLIKCLINNKNIIKSKSERAISIAAICAKNKNKKRDIDIGKSEGKLPMFLYAFCE